MIALGFFALIDTCAAPNNAKTNKEASKPVIFGTIKFNGKTVDITENEFFEIISASTDINADAMQKIKNEPQYKKMLAENKPRILRQLAVSRVLSDQAQKSPSANKPEVKEKIQKASELIIAKSFQDEEIEKRVKSISKNNQKMKEIKRSVKKRGPLYEVIYTPTSTTEAKRIEEKLESVSTNSKANEWEKLVNQHLKLKSKEETLTAYEIKEYLKITEGSLKVGAVIVLTPDPSKDQSLVFFVKSEKTFEDGVQAFDELVKQKITEQAKNSFIDELLKDVVYMDSDGKKIEVKDSAEDNKIED